LILNNIFSMLSLGQLDPSKASSTINKVIQDFTMLVGVSMRGDYFRVVLERFRPKLNRVVINN
jgi:hypothetical protein